MPDPPTRRSLLSLRLLLIHALALVLISAMAAMGWWQSSRYDAQQRAASAEVAADAEAAAPVPLGSLLSADGAFPLGEVGTKVVTAGRYAPAGDQFYVGSQERNRRDGYWVLTPLLVEDSAIMVVRGWVPHPDAAAALPTGSRRVVGWLMPSDPPATTTDADPSDRIVRAVQIASLVSQVPYDLYGGYVVLAEQRPPEPSLPTVARPAQEATASAGWRNLAYAAQWWIFALFVAFMWWRVAREARPARLG